MHGQAAIALTALLMFAGCTQETATSDDLELKELVIRHLEQTSESVPTGASHVVIETFDRRAELVAATGIFRSQQEDRERVGRLWVELRSAGSSWKPETILIRSQDESNAEGVTWP